MNNQKHKALVPFLAIIAGILVGFILLIITNKNPLILFEELIKGSFSYDDMKNVAFMKELVPEFKSVNSPFESIDRVNEVGLS